MTHGTAEQDKEKIDAVWGDPQDWAADGWHWTHLEAIQQMNNRHVTGDPHLSDMARFFEQIVPKERPVPVERALVLACGGTTGLEHGIYRAGWVKEIVAVDISPRAVAAAAAATKAAGITGIHYQVGDMNALDVEGPFDVVFGVSALHHCAELENLYAAVERVMAPDGWFFIQDFVGPTRFQWTEDQVLLINRLLHILPERFLVNRKNYRRRDFWRVEAEVLAAFDPSEAVRSSEILPLLKERFHVEEVRGFGGGLLHLALATIAHNFDVAQSGDPTGPEYLRLLIEASDELRRQGRTQDDFAFALARHRRT
ncbi:class I SAM-dependent methyltransferase [Lacibacterium aquatile]|uniref:Class I SAM-dependent methyltransferase n=1 Tax=Lacibacterium aquatile TaxID=1168082 RepID=A0ABW5DV89_9PROT